MSKNKFNLRNMVAIAIYLSGLTMFSGCNKDNNTSDKGVIINGIKWATCNIDTPGTFVAKPEDAGKFFQWNRKTAWPTTGSVSSWDTNCASSKWEKTNDPSPVGWHVPTLDEIKTLFETNRVSNIWTTVNGVAGRKFIDNITGNSIFLPAAGKRGCYFEQKGDPCEFSGELNDVGEFGYYWSSTKPIVDPRTTWVFTVADGAAPINTMVNQCVV
jgi:hypothetical protein